MLADYQESNKLENPIEMEEKLNFLTCTIGYLLK